MLRPLHEILIEKPLVLEANLSDLKLSKVDLIELDKSRM